MKKRRWIIGIFSLILILFGVLYFVKTQENKRIPYITFMHNFNRASCLYICSDGGIYASTSEEAFLMEYSEIIRKIQQNNYSDILRFMGTTDDKDVRKMYRLFSRVALNEDYRVEARRLQVPQSEEYGGRREYWGGFYYDESGELVYELIYQSNSDMYCTDERAYKIVDWMYECLKEYMKY